MDAAGHKTSIFFFTDFVVFVGRRFVVRAAETDTDKGMIFICLNVPFLQFFPLIFNLYLTLLGLNLRRQLNLRHRTRHQPVVRALTSFWVSKEHLKRL